MAEQDAPSPRRDGPRLGEHAIAVTMERLVAERGAGKSICPSEVARALVPEAWSPLMGAVRRVAVRLALAGRIAILRKGRPVDPTQFRGVYRLALPGARADTLQGAGNSAEDRPVSA